MKANKFNFLQKEQTFSFTSPLLDSFIIRNYREKTALLINLYMDNDDETNKLLKTLNSLVANLESLKKDNGILSENILIILFIREIKDIAALKYIFGNEYNIDLEGKQGKLICSLMKYKIKELNEINLDILITYKEGMSKYEMYKDFFIGFCNELRKGPALFELVPIFTLFLHVGVYPLSNSISLMVKSLTGSADSDINLMSNKSIYVCGSVNSDINNNFFSNVRSYEYILENISENHFRNNSNSLKFNEKFSMLKVNQFVYNVIEQYFTKNTNNVTNSNRVFNNLFLLNLINSDKGKDYDLRYIPLCEAICDNDTNFDLWMSVNTDDLSAQFLSFFEYFQQIFCCLGNKEKFFFGKYMKNFLNLYHMLVMIIYFTIPGLFIFIMYTLLLESFNHPKEVYILIVSYAFLIMLTGFISQTGNPKVLKIFYFILYISYMLFYLLLIICSILTINNIRRKDHSFYIDTYITLVIVNLIFSIIPHLLNYKKMLYNIKPLIFYILGVCNHSSLFLIYSIFNISVTDNTKDNSNQQIKKAIIIVFFLIINTVFSFLIFILDEKTTRLHSVFIVFLIFTFFYFIKTFFIIIDFVRFDCKKNNIFNNQENIKNLIGKFYNNILDEKEIIEFLPKDTPEHLEKMANNNFPSNYSSNLYQNQFDNNIIIEHTDEQSNLSASNNQIQKHRFKRKSQIANSNAISKDDIAVDIKDI